MKLAPLLPKEHGTWAMLLVPWLVGCGVARRLGWREWLLLVAMTLAFLAHNQLLIWYRLRLVPASAAAARAAAGRRCLVLAALGGLAFVPLLAGWRLAWLLALGAPAGAAVGASLELVRRRRDHTLAGQVLAPLGLALGAPAAHAMARGALDATALALYGLCVLFFLGAVFYVRLKIEALKRSAALATPTARLRFAAWTLALDVAIAAAALVVLLLGGLSPWAIVALAPTAAQAVVGAARLHRPARLRRVGILAAVHSAAFALLVVWLA